MEEALEFECAIRGYQEKLPIYLLRQAQKHCSFQQAVFDKDKDKI